MIISEDNYLAHYGVLRRSGRYPWGSGGPEYASNKSFLGYVDELHKKGMTPVEIARGMGITTTQLRAAKSIAKNEEKQAQIGQAQKLKDHGYSTMEIGRRMGVNESTVRGLLAPGARDKAERLNSTANMLKDAVDRKTYIQIGSGVEHHIGVSTTTLNNAVAQLKEHGYEVHSIKIDQVGTGNKTDVKVLCPPGTVQKDVWQNRDKITMHTDMQTDDGGRSFLGIKPPLSISSKRVGIVYGPDGGTAADGVIYVRPGVHDITMGAARYAQVRIAIDGSHYLKGMAVYKDDLPAGVDLQFHTNKKDTGNKLDAMKPIKDDPENPFGSIVRQRIDPLTKQVTSALNIVGTKDGSGEEGAWDKWSNTLSSQFLSKQSPTLARSQLALVQERRKLELNEILALTNPSVKKKLLESYADGADSAAVHLKAAAMPRQRNQVILPINSLKENEVYAPNFDDGERVTLVRFPHGGTFEIPELTVNNRNREGRRMIGIGAKVDAVGIHSKVAERLSGADFDGDTVLVIPNNHGKIKSTPGLESLKTFNRDDYKLPDSVPRMKAKTKGIQMGMISNLITDMTLQGAPTSELSRAVRHSMVVIDAEKHHLDYKRSAQDFGIAALQKKYQTPHSDTGKPGAATLISRRKSTIKVNDRALRKASDGGAIDPITGKLVYSPTGASYEKRTVDKHGNITTQTVIKKIDVGKLAEAANAHDLASGTKMEAIYADHSNAMKALANQARREYVSVKTDKYSSSAKKVYAQEVADLNAKLNIAIRNRPLERQAQLLANAKIAAIKNSDPSLENAELKKISGAALIEARNRTGAGKELIHITDGEWAAIQAGAITPNKLEAILNNADLDRVRELATPRQATKLTGVAMARARTMADSGYTQPEIAKQLGVSLSALKNALSDTTA